MKKSILIMMTILISVLVLCGIGVGVYKYMKKSHVHNKPQPLTAAQDAALQVAFPQMVCNLQDDLVQFTVTVQADKSSTKDEITAMMPQIEDKINYMTREFTADEVRQPSGFTKLKADILSAVNGQLPAGQATKIYLSQIVVQ